MHRQHPAEQPPLSRTPLWPLHERVTVIALDANIVMTDLHRLAKENGKPPALLELAAAARVRLIMSAEDLKPNEAGVSRMEHNIATRDDYAAQANAMLDLWRHQIRPGIHVLDPTGFNKTDMSRQVEARDIDDEPLARLVHVVGADAFFSSDRHFKGLLPVLKHSMHGSILSWLRHSGRVEQAQEIMGSLPGIAMVAVNESVKGIARLLKRPVTEVWLALGLLGGAALASPAVRRALPGGLAGYVGMLSSIEPDAEVIEQIQTAWQTVRVVPQGSDEPLVQMARFLAHRTTSVTTTEGVRKLGVSMTPGQLARCLQAHPGVFCEVSRGRWELRR